MPGSPQEQTLFRLHEISRLPVLRRAGVDSIEVTAARTTVRVEPYGAATRFLHLVHSS